MEGNPTIMFRRTLAIAAGAALVLAGALAVQPATATDLPTGNAMTECTAAGYDYGVKLSTKAPGVYVYATSGDWEPDNLNLDLTVTIIDQKNFSWSSADPDVGAVLVKAGPGYTVFVGGDSGSGTVVKDISHITFCYGEPENEPEEELTVTKTVDESYKRTHDWTLEKSVNPEHVWLHIPGEGTSTGMATWTIEVGYAGYVDSDHTVSGTVTVENTGDTSAAVDELTDTMTIGGVPTAVTLDCGAVELEGDLVHILLPSESFECTYSMAVAGQVAGSNMATAETLTGGMYSSAAMPIVWGGPTSELNEKVTLTDVGDLGTRTPVEFTAPTGGTVTYSHTFNWADYGQEDCGNHEYDNTATLTGDTLLLTDTAMVTVHVQCYVFDDETAWAANDGPGTLPYNTKKGGSWATYVAYPGGVQVYDVYAGQNMFVGTATVTPIGGGMVTVTVDLIGDWEYAEVGSNLKIQTYPNAPSGNPSPGSFAYKTTCTMDPCTSGPIPVANYYGIHLDVGVWVPDPMFP